jgi:hypothetical protein
VCDQGPVATVTFAVFNVREEYRLRVFKNTVLKKIFGHETEGTVRDLTKLHSEEFMIYTQLVLTWLTPSQRIGWVGHVT